MSTSRRIGYLDFAKGVCVLLVIVGHCLRSLASVSLLPYNGGDLLSVRVIYSFHMPLFMLISGFLCNTAKPLSTYVFEKTRRLIWPMFLWSTITFCIKLLIGGGGEINEFLTRFFSGYWFLWITFICSILAWFIDKISIGLIRLLIVASIEVILFFLPGLIPSQGSYAFVLPYFFIAHLVKNQVKLDRINKVNIASIKSIVALVLWNLLFMFLMFFYSRDVLIDVSDFGFRASGLNIEIQLRIDILRLVIGVLNSITAIIDIYYFYRILKKMSKKLNNYIKWIGKESLLFYILHYIFAAYLIQALGGRFGISPIYVIVFSLLALVGTSVMIFIIRKLNVISKIIG